MVFLRRFQTGRVVSSHHGHSGRVNSVSGVQRDGRAGFGPSELISTSSDTTAVVWTITENGKLILTRKLESHSGSVNACSGATLQTAGGWRTTVVTSSSDSTVRVWTRNRDEDNFTCTQTLSFGTGFALAVSLIRIPDTEDLLLACGCDDQKIHIYSQQNQQFVKVHTLAGHEDWIRGLDFTLDDKGDILLATCSQDHYIRIWRLVRRHVTSRQADVTSLDEAGGELKMKERTFSYLCAKGAEVRYAVVLESVLAGHDGWVYAARWQPPIITADGPRHQPMRLLSASMDKTMIIWAPDAESGVWLEKMRVGTVGGNTLGLYGCQFSPGGGAIIAHGYQGALHLWHRVPDPELETWRPSVTVGGHFADVTDLAWDPVSGEYLLTVSADQTTRLHGEWKREGQNSVWHELARPQVHGYDLHTVTMIDRYRFASGADEKVVRVFAAPRNFVDNFRRMCDTDLTTNMTGLSLSDLPEGASIPALGLSNKAIFQTKTKQDSGGDQNGGQDGGHNFGQNVFEESTKPAEGYFKAATLEEPPCEEDLLQNTLWPESVKLYGHGYEIFALSASPDGRQLASACKAAKPEHANILIWDCRTWKQSQSLTSHSLTVTRLQFSPCSRYLLSVSRDRTWTLFKRLSQDDVTLSRVAGTDKKTSVHTRIIWSCAWTRDSKYYVTVSRDKKAIFWHLTEEKGDNSPLGCVEQVPHVLELSRPVTAVDIAPVMVADSYLVSLGLETGQIEMFRFSPVRGWDRLHSLDTSEAHHNTVKRLRFRPVTSQSPDVIQLASCGMDNAVKIYDVTVR